MPKRVGRQVTPGFYGRTDPWMIQTKYALETKADFNGDGKRDRVIMEKIERYAAHLVPDAIERDEEWLNGEYDPDTGYIVYYDYYIEYKQKRGGFDKADPTVCGQTVSYIGKDQEEYVGRLFQTSCRDFKDAWEDGQNLNDGRLVLWPIDPQESDFEDAPIQIAQTLRGEPMDINSRETVQLLRGITATKADVEVVESSE